MIGEHVDSEIPITLNPSPSILIESLRDIGYSFKSALADIIDNSISAGASLIRIETDTSGDPVLAVIDNGDGLTSSELFDSMRMGSSNPRELRRKSDLGRFGLGLKTASFSQCRKLTVLSRKEGVTSGFCWDLDRVVEDDNWSLMPVSDFTSLPFFSEFSSQSGTMVLWEKLDRAYDASQVKDVAEHAFLRQLSDAEEHLSLVFHRFIGFESGYKKIAIELNGSRLAPLDPSNTDHEATITHPIEPVSDGVTIQCFTLPHSSKYKDKREYERYGLSGGYLKNQGIYLYRARRLIIHGTWFGLAKKTNLTQLCRVKVDIDNKHDEEWKIDVKKVSAQLPESARAAIRNLLNVFNAPSRKVYQRRGARQTSEALYPVWNQQRDNGNISFTINRDHPLVQSFASGLDEEESRSFNTLMRLIEAGFPTEAIHYELSNSPESVTAPTVEGDDLKRIAGDFFKSLKAQGMEEESIRSIMRASSVFEGRWEDTLSALGIEER